MSFSAKVEGSVPIVVERAMYISGGGGHGVTGVTSPSLNWFFAEGDTRAGYDTWLLLMNPNSAPVSASIILAGENGSLSASQHTINPKSRYSLFVNQLMSDTRLSIRVNANQPIIAERAIYFGRGGAHATVGTPSLLRTWYVPEGSTAPPFQEYLIVANHNSFSVDVAVTWMQAGGKNFVQNVSLLPNARATINANKIIPNAALSARVDASAPVAVERSMYFGGGNGGTNTIAIPGEP